MAQTDELFSLLNDRSVVYSGEEEDYSSQHGRSNHDGITSNDQL